MIISLLSAAACNTLLGQPGTESELLPDATGPSFPYDRYVEGKPSFDLRARGGFYIWKIQNAWHVRIAKRFDRPRMIPPVWPVLKGSLLVENGLAVDIRKQNMSPSNDVRLRRNNTITFTFELRDDIGNDIEGFDFIVKPTHPDYCVTLDMTLDGIPRPEAVYLGSFMHTPAVLPVKICMRSF